MGTAASLRHPPAVSFTQFVDVLSGLCSFGRCFQDSFEEEPEPSLPLAIVTHSRQLQVPWNNSPHHTLLLQYMAIFWNSATAGSAASSSLGS